MKRYKKTLCGSILAFIVGTSCCWVSSLAVWAVGISSAGLIVKYINNLQVVLIVIGTLLMVFSVFLYLKMRKK